MKKVKEVRPLSGFQLEVVFDNGETRYFDVTPYMEKGIFSALRHEGYFRQVAVKFDGVGWPDDQDLSPDTLYIKGRRQAQVA